MYSVVVVERDTDELPEVYKFELLKEVIDFCECTGLGRIGKYRLKPGPLSVYRNDGRSRNIYVLNSNFDYVDLRDLGIMKYDGNI